MLKGTIPFVNQLNLCSVFDADLIECIKLLVRLKEQKLSSSVEHLTLDLADVIKRKITALRNAEQAVVNSPTILRTDSPRLLHSPRNPKNGSPEQGRGIPTIRDFTIVKTITEGAFGYITYRISG